MEYFPTSYEIALFVEFFIPGMAALTPPEWWAYHLTWVAFFQWLVVPLPVLARFVGPLRRWRIPFVQIGLKSMQHNHRSTRLLHIHWRPMPIAHSVEPSIVRFG